MKTFGMVVLAFALMGAASPSAVTGVTDGVELSTARRVHGVITAVEPETLTIASAQRAVSGKIDPARTRVTINGHPGKVADLKLTAHAKGELCLDDVWLAIDAH